VKRYHNGSGNVYEQHGALHVRWWTCVVENGELRRVQRSKKLCNKDREHSSARSKSVRDLAAKFTATLADRPQVTDRNVTVRDFYEHRYLPYVERPRSVDGRAPLKLSSVRSCASAIFKRALVENVIDRNPWRDVPIPDDAVDSPRTGHYTPEESEDLVSALVDHVDCQLVLALSCFLALRPSEIAALRWEDFDAEWVHVRRAVVRGVVDTPKTEESVAPLPLIDQVRVPLELWRAKCAMGAGLLLQSLFGLDGDTPRPLPADALRSQRTGLTSGLRKKELAPRPSPTQR
jgi:integrase